MNNLKLNGICLDSRQVSPGDLFIAVSGEKQDGRQFIQDAIDRGAIAVIAEPSSHLSEMKFKSIPIIQYSNLKNAIGYIASRFYHDPSHHLPIIGITGTNGKTSCSHFIAQLSHFFNKSCGVIGTLGAGFLPDLTSFDLTTPDAVSLQGFISKLQKNNASYIAMEVTSHALSQGRVAGIQFHTAIFTNLTQDHLDYYENFAAYFQAKQKLFTELKPRNVIINLDDPFGQELALMLIDQKIEKQTIFGITTEEKLNTNTNIAIQSKQIKNLITTHGLEMNEMGVTAEIRSPWGSGLLQCPLLGRFNLSNVLASISALCLQGLPLTEILARIPNLEPVAGRMNRFGGGLNEPSIVIDYAHTPDALAKVLEALRPHCQGKLWCIFGCGGERDAGKRPLMANVAEQWSDNIIVTNDNPRTEDEDKIISDIIKGFSKNSQKNIQVEPDRAKAIQFAIEKACSDDLIVIAGKGHETYQIIQTEKIPFQDESHAKAALLNRRQI